MSVNFLSFQKSNFPTLPRTRAQRGRRSGGPRAPPARESGPSPLPGKAPQAESRPFRAPPVCRGRGLQRQRPGTGVAATKGPGPRDQLLRIADQRRPLSDRGAQEWTAQPGAGNQSPDPPQVPVATGSRSRGGLGDSPQAGLLGLYEHRSHVITRAM